MPQDKGGEKGPEERMLIKAELVDAVLKD